MVPLVVILPRFDIYRVFYTKFKMLQKMIHHMTETYRKFVQGSGFLTKS